ncbi:MAG: hypothetical protein KG012_12560 [Deltaproteobacteria bacterium]|nr:hypothetical protein [Deltaproteobacteria bacterium]
MKRKEGVSPLALFFNQFKNILVIQKPESRRCLREGGNPKDMNLDFCFRSNDQSRRFPTFRDHHIYSGGKDGRFVSGITNMA